MIGLLIELAVVVIVFALLYWILGQIQLPEPIKKIVNIVLVILATIFLIWLLLQLPGLLGAGGWKLPR